MKTCLYLFLMFLAAHNSYAQLVFNEENERKKESAITFYGVSFSAGIGLINPQEINRYIEQEINSRQIQIYQGSAEIRQAFAGCLSVNTRIKERIVIRGFFEAAWAAKVISVQNSSDLRYNMFAVSPGASVEYTWKTSMYNELFVGAGPIFNRISFQKNSGRAVSPRIEVGFSFLRPSLTTDILLGIDFMRQAEITRNLTASFNGLYLTSRITVW